MATPTPSAEMIRIVQRKTNELDSTTYSLNDIEAMIANYPLIDEDGREPDHVDWTGDWDLNQAIADIWEEKATKYAADFDFSADGGDYARSQVFEQMRATAKMYRARRSTKAVRVTVRPRPDRRYDRTIWVGNLPEMTDYEV